MGSEQGKVETREIEEGWREVEKKKTSEKDWPNKDHMNCHVYWVFVVGSVESKVIFEVKQADFRHFD